MTLHIERFYPIGTPGQAWDDKDQEAWLARQQWQRSYADEVTSRIDPLKQDFDVLHYGTLDYGAKYRYPLHLLKARVWDETLPTALVTGGVHGYETSGVHGALDFASTHAAAFAGRLNILVAPCISPWGYEHIQRWNADALDPNRNFHALSQAQECRFLIAAVAPFRERIVVHIDLHETTDTDETEFRRALAARNGEAFVAGEIPDGFYLCGDSKRPAANFQACIIDAVREVTHIAPADEAGNIIGSPMVAPGVINYDLVELGLCAGITDAVFRTTTEVYPDSVRATSQECNLAQAIAARAALTYAADHL